MDHTPRSIADYGAVTNPVRTTRQAESGNQPGEPAKATQALLALVEDENPPVRSFLGEDALGVVEQKLDGIRAEMAAWTTLSRSTGFAS